MGHEAPVQVVLCAPAVVLQKKQRMLKSIGVPRQNIVLLECGQELELEALRLQCFKLTVMSQEGLGLRVCASESPSPTHSLSLHLPVPVRTSTTSESAATASDRPLMDILTVMPVMSGVEVMRVLPSSYHSMSRRCTTSVAMTGNVGEASMPRTGSSSSCATT